MAIIDRYLLRQFIRTFLICYLSLTGLYIVFDAFTNLEEFRSSADKEGGVLALMVRHYGYKSILFFDQTQSLLALLSSMFTVAWLQRHNEMTALMAAGISRVRIVLPLIGAAGVVSGLALVNRELVMPQIREELVRKATDLLGDKGQQLAPRYDYETNVFFRGRETFRNEMRIRAPDFLLPLELSPYGKQIVAANAFYKPPRGQRPGGYLFEGITSPTGLDARPSLSLKDQPVLLTPRNTRWLRPGQCFLVSNLTFDQLTGEQSFRQFSSTLDLIRALRNPSLDFGADVRVTIHTRFIQPFLDMTLLLLGLPLVATRQSRNVFVAMGLCCAVVTVFLLFVIASQYLGASYFIRSASLAAWLPLIVFAPAAVAMLEGLWR